MVLKRAQFYITWKCGLLYIKCRFLFVPAVFHHRKAAQIYKISLVYQAKSGHYPAISRIKNVCLKYEKKFVGNI